MDFTKVREDEEKSILEKKEIVEKDFGDKNIIFKELWG